MFLHICAQGPKRGEVVRGEGGSCLINSGQCNSSVQNVGFSDWPLLGLKHACNHVVHIVALHALGREGCLSTRVVASMQGSRHERVAAWFAACA